MFVCYNCKSSYTRNLNAKSYQCLFGRKMKNSRSYQTLIVVKVQQTKSYQL